MRITYTTRMMCLAAPLLILAGCGEGETVETEASTASPEGSQPGVNQPVEATSAQEAYPQVALETTHGRIVLELDSVKAPDTVRNFLAYVASGHYDGTLFHQVEQGYVLLGGGYTPEMQLKPTDRPIRNEAENGLRNETGTIAMARSPETIDSSTCQFFINLADNADLDHHAPTAEGFGYCVFGRVIDGWNVVESIASIPVQSSQEYAGRPQQTVMIRSAKRLR